MKYRVYAWIADYWSLQLLVSWTREIFWVKSDFCDAIHTASLYPKFFNPLVTQ